MDNLKKNEKNISKREKKVIKKGKQKEEKITRKINYIKVKLYNGDRTAYFRLQHVFLKQPLSQG